MNGISCDECSAGYRPGMLADCTKCNGEYCDSCHRNHKCGKWYHRLLFCISKNITWI